MQVSCEQGPDCPIPFEVVLAPLHGGGHGTNLEPYQLSFKMVPHAPNAVEVSRALAAFSDGSRHHDEVDQVEHLSPFLRVALGQLIQEQGHLLVDFSVDSLSHSDFLGSVGGWNSVVDAHESEQLLQDGRSELLASIMPDVHGHGQSAQHGCAHRLHGVILLERLAGNQHGGPQKLAGVRQNVTVSVYTLRERPLEINVDIQPGSQVGFLIGYGLKHLQRLASHLDALLAGGAPMVCVLGHARPVSHLTENGVSSSCIAMPGDGSIVHLFVQPATPSDVGLKWANPGGDVRNESTLGGELEEAVLWMQSVPPSCVGEPGMLASVHPKVLLTFSLG